MVEPIHHSILAQQVGELSDVRSDASCLIAYDLDGLPLM